MTSPDVCRILIAEDDPVIARVLSRQLEREGFAVEVAGNGNDAITAISQSQFDFLLADYQMPDMTGVDLCRHLRSLPEFDGLCMALCTAKAHEIDMDSLTEELRLANVFFKPFSLREIATSIRETIGLRSAALAD